MRAWELTEKPLIDRYDYLPMWKHYQCTDCKNIKQMPRNWHKCADCRQR